MLLQAMGILQRANKSLRRTFPPRDDYVRDLLLRDAYQSKYVDAVYAVGLWEEPKKSVLGIASTLST